MVRAEKIYGKIAEKQLLKRDVAKALGVSEYGLRRKLRGDLPMKISEAQKLIDLLDIENPGEIFFAPEVAEVNEVAEGGTAP